MTEEKRTRAANGRGTIYEDANHKWHGYVSMGVRPDGKPDRRHVEGKTQQQVADRMAVLVRKRDRGDVLTAGKTLTVGEWLAYWLDTTAAAKVRPRTLDGYRTLVDHHLVPKLGAHRLDRLEVEHVERMQALMLGEGLAPATVVKAHRVLSRALYVAQQRGRVSRNVCKLVDPPSINRAEVEPLSIEEARAVLAAAKTLRNAARWSVALSLGLRQGEALGLLWSDVDLDRGTLRVRRALQRQTGKGLLLVEPKSRAGRRTIPLPAQLVAALIEHRGAQDAEREKAAELWQDNGMVFAQENGRMVDPRADWQAWRDLLVSAGVRVRQVPDGLDEDGKPITRSVTTARLHDARHTAASLMLAQGVPARVAMEVLGHSQIGLTLGTYSHVAPELSRDAAEAVGGVLWG